MKVETAWIICISLIGVIICSIITVTHNQYNKADRLVAELVKSGSSAAEARFAIYGKGRNGINAVLVAQERK